MNKNFITIMNEFNKWAVKKKFTSLKSALDCAARCWKKNSNLKTRVLDLDNNICYYFGDGTMKTRPLNSNEKKLMGMQHEGGATGLHPEG